MCQCGQQRFDQCDLGECEKKKEKAKNQRGQLVLEYILLMILAVSMAVLAKGLFVGGSSKDIQNAGILNKMFYAIVMPIAEDQPGK